MKKMSAEQKLAKIAKIFETVRKRNGLNMSSHAYYNMMGALEDIERTGECDSVSLKTLKRVHKQLGQIGQVLSSR